MSDDAWRELRMLAPADREATEEELSEWVDSVPVHDRVHLERRIMLRERRLACGVRLDFTVPAANEQSVWILKVWTREP